MGNLMDPRQSWQIIDMQKNIVRSFIAGVLAAIFVTALWIKHDAIRPADAYTALFAGNVELLSISFDGQRRSVKVEDRSVINDFERAFENKKRLSNKGGTAYTAIFAFKTGVKIKTDVYIYTDKNGFSVADYSRLGAGDPTYVDVEFSGEKGKKTRELIEYLLSPTVGVFN